MGKKDSHTDAISKLLEVLADFGPVPIVITVLGIVFLMRLDKIIHAASAALKQQKETNQRLQLKRQEFEKKQEQTIVTKETPTRKRTKQSRNTGDKQ